MKFTQFLVEQNKSHINQSDIIYHSILDNIDHGHVAYSDDQLKFNVGKIIKNSSYNNLEIVIKQGTDGVKLGKHKESGTPTVVIFTEKKFPSQDKLGTFLENPELASNIKANIRKYLKNHHTPQLVDAEHASSYEKPKMYSAKLEDHYKKLIKAIHNKIGDYHTAKTHVETKKSGNEAKNQLKQAAIKHILNDTLGTSFKEFKKKVMELDEASFIEHLPKELKDKVLSRLEGFYDQEVSSL